MSAPNNDPHGRFRSKTVAFRVSPEEADLLQRLADVSGMTKQDYVISRVLQRDVTVVPNKRMQRYMEEAMLMLVRELRRLDGASAIAPELSELAAQVCSIYVGLGKEGDLRPQPSESKFIERMVR